MMVQINVRLLIGVVPIAGIRRQRRPRWRRRCRRHHPRLFWSISLQLW